MDKTLSQIGMIHVDPGLAIAEAESGGNCDFYVLRRHAKKPAMTYEFSYAVDATNVVYGAWVALLFGETIDDTAKAINRTLYKV